jgi:hypothetical protein
MYRRISPIAISDLPALLRATAVSSDTRAADLDFVTWT